MIVVAEAAPRSWDWFGGVRWLLHRKAGAPETAASPTSKVVLLVDLEYARIVTACRDRDAEQARSAVSNTRWRCRR